MINIKTLLHPYKSDSYKISVEWQGDCCRLSFTNLTKEAILPTKIIVFESEMPYSPDTPIYGEGYNKLCQYGGTIGNVEMTATLGDLGHYKLPAPNGFGQVYNMLAIMPQNEPSLLMGFSSCKRFNGEFWLNSKQLQVMLNIEGIEIAAGETFELESFFAASGERAMLLERFAAELQKNHPLLATEEIPTGWCSWLVYGPSVTSQNIYDNVAAIKKHELDLKYIQIDDGYQAYMGDWLTEIEGFDGGIKKLCLDIKAEGLEPAIWVAPFIAEEKSGVFQSHPDWFVKDENGEPLASNKVSFGGWRNAPWYMLDGTNPAARQHLTDVFKTMRQEWKVKYFKLDANMWGAMPYGVRFEKNKTCVEAYRMGMEAVLEGAGKDSFLLGCNAPMWPSIGAVHGMRITNDNSRYFDTFRELAKTCFPRNWQHNKLWVNDPDTILLCNRNQGVLDPAGNQSISSTLSHEEFLFNATYTLASGGMVLSSDDITGFNEQNCKDLKKLLPAIKVAAVFDDPDFKVGRIKLDNEQIICIFNYTDTADSFEVSIGERSELVNFWTDESLGNVEKGVHKFSLEPHNALALRVKAI